MVNFGSPETLAHSEKLKLVVIIMAIRLAIVQRMLIERQLVAILTR